MKFSNKKYYCLFDTSNIIFRIALTSFKLYCNQYTSNVLTSDLGPEFNPCIDPEFVEIFNNKFNNYINKAINQLVPFSFKAPTVCFALDDPTGKSSYWRRLYYPFYKSQRDSIDHSNDKFNLTKVFNYAVNNTIPASCKTTGAKTLQFDSAEADDIIGVLSTFLTQLSENNEVIIFSTDRDMLQLSSERIKVFSGFTCLENPQRAIENQANNKKKLSTILDADDFLLFKILIGDKSDNIPAILNRFGTKTALSYVLDKSKKKLKQLLTESSEACLNFKRNKTLIAFSEIPKELSTGIVDEWIKTVSNQT